MTLLAGALAEAKLLGTKLRSHCCELDLGRSQLLCGILAEYRDYLVDERGQALPPVDAAAMTNARGGGARRLRGRTSGTPSSTRRRPEGWGAGVMTPPYRAMGAARASAAGAAIADAGAASSAVSSAYGPFCRFHGESMRL
jgi:hypothetical protein